MDLCHCGRIDWRLKWIGHMITDSQALMATDQIIFGIIVIGLIGLVTDIAFKTFNRWLFPWARLS